MARSKWISFTAQQALNRDAQKSAKPADSQPSTVPTEIKKFGLENVRRQTCMLLEGHSFLVSYDSLEILGESYRCGVLTPG
jgi:hypothetical protein